MHRRGYNCLMVVLLGFLETVLQNGYNLYIPTSNIWEIPLLCTSWAFGIGIIFNFNCSHHGLNFHVSNGKWYWISTHLLFSHPCIHFDEMSFPPPTPTCFLSLCPTQQSNSIACFCLFVCLFMSWILRILRIFWIRFLSQVYSLWIFSPSLYVVFSSSLQDLCRATHFGFDNLGFFVFYWPCF